MSSRFQFPENFQDTILSCWVKFPDKFDKFGDIMQPSFFGSDIAMSVAKVAFDYRAKYHQMPHWDMLEELSTAELRKVRPDDSIEGYLKYIDKLRKKKTRDIEAVVEKVAYFARSRAIMACIKACAQIYNEKPPGMEERLVNLVNEAVKVGQLKEEDSILLHRDWSAVIDKLTSASYGISTGFKSWDDIWPNGWGPGWLVVPMAPPKRFKSAMCVNIALNMIKPKEGAGVDVLYYACEISKELSVQRMMLNMSGKDERFMHSDTEKFKLAVSDAMDEQVGANLFVTSYPAMTASISDIARHARNLIAEHDLKVRAIVIDYAETVRPEKPEEKAYIQQAGIYTAARALGSELQCTIIMPDRCNKETVGSIVPDMTGFQGSFQKAGIVDVAIGICAREEELANGQLRTFIFLNRHGEAEVQFHGTIDPKLMKITVGDRFLEAETDAQREQAKEDKRASRGSKSKKGAYSDMPTDDDIVDDHKKKKNGRSKRGMTDDDEEED